MCFSRSSSITFTRRWVIPTCLQRPRATKGLRHMAVLSPRVVHKAMLLRHETEFRLESALRLGNLLFPQELRHINHIAPKTDHELFYHGHPPLGRFYSVSSNRWDWTSVSAKPETLIPLWGQLPFPSPLRATLNYEAIVGSNVF